MPCHGDKILYCTGYSQPTSRKNKNTENIVVVLVIGPLILLDSHGSRPLSASFLIRTSGKDNSQSQAWSTTGVRWGDIGPFCHALIPRDSRTWGWTDQWLKEEVQQYGLDNVEKIWGGSKKGGYLLMFYPQSTLNSITVMWIKRILDSSIVVYCAECILWGSARNKKILQTQTYVHWSWPKNDIIIPCIKRSLS